MANTTGKKYGGRKKGTPNKLTKDLREMLKGIFQNEMLNLEDHIQNLESKERIELMIKLMPYILPKVQSVVHNIGEPIDFDVSVF